MQQLTATKTIKEPGYVYIYLSNEGNVQQDIYFDDLTITHEKSRVIQNDDYYPFGLTFNSSKRENSVTNAYQYNGKEMQDELGLGMLDYGARMYMSDIGRWGVIDPLAEKSRRWSPYTYVYDNPLRFIDPDGMEGMGINPITGGARGEGNAIEFRKWRDVSDPAKRAEELWNNRTRTPRLGTCSTCPKDSKYDQFRESDMPFAYEEGVGVYNDFEVDAQQGGPGDGDYAWYQFFNDHNPGGDFLYEVNKWNPIANIYNAISTYATGEDSYGVKQNKATATLQVASSIPIGKISGGIMKVGNFIVNSGALTHIFRNAVGHVNPSTLASQNRFLSLFSGVASNPNNLVPTANLAAREAGVLTYQQNFANGQVWVQIKEGVITNAGVNRLP